MSIVQLPLFYIKESAPDFELVYKSDLRKIAHLPDQEKEAQRFLLWRAYIEEGIRQGWAEEIQSNNSFEQIPSINFLEKLKNVFWKLLRKI